jgi:5-methylcytosine-specific restriction endonuclease McrA
MSTPAYAHLLDEAAAAAAAHAAAVAAKRKRKSAGFYSSAGWRRLRYRVLAESAKAHGGRAACELCGAHAAPGEPLNADHIVPVSRDWSRRLDPRNLQILCVHCNLGKSNRDDTDFRSPSAPPQP